jgi:hypothetical protein
MQIFAEEQRQGSLDPDLKRTEPFDRRPRQESFPEMSPDDPKRSPQQKVAAL